MNAIHRGLVGIVCGMGVLVYPGFSRAAGAPLPGPAVVELFTSEGCDSCPPAEAVLGALAGRPDVIALAFHVTYWDSAAWRDRFGFGGAVERQDRYVRRLGLRSAYTPQGVINGSLDVLGSDAQRIRLAVEGPGRPQRLELARETSGLVVRLPEFPAGCPCEVRLLGVRASAETAVLGGENGGKTLKEYRIVRSASVVSAWDGRAAERSLSLEGLPTDATSVVVLVERPSDGVIVAAGEVAL